MVKRSLLALALLAAVIGIPFGAHAWTYYFGDNLRYGETGADIPYLQQYLSQEGYFQYSTTTDHFGPVTLAAVKAWQAANGIPSTGFFGPISRAFVNGTGAPAASSSDVSMIWPLQGSTLGENVLLYASVSSSAPAAPVGFSIDGAAPGAGAVATSAPYFVWATLAPGTHTVVAHVTDVDGVEHDSAPVTFAVAAPSSSDPTDGAPYAPCVTECGGVTFTPGTADSATTTVTASTSLTGYWPLDEGSGTVAYDGSGNGLNGTWSGTQSSASGTYYTAGLIGPSAGYFNGSNDYIGMGSSTLFDSQDVTMSAWVYPTDESVQRVVMGKEEQYKFAVHNGQFDILESCDGAEWDVNTPISGSAPLDAWTYATFVVNSTDGINQFYINGNLVSSSTNCGTITNFNADTFEIGGYSGANAPFAGAIDDARFYTRALTASEVQALYDAVTVPVAISITPTSTMLMSGASTTFSATVSDATNTAVTWSATLGSINASGTYTAPTLASTTSVATGTVTAMSVADGTKIATATVTVTNGLVDEWPLNEGSGAVAYNAVNSANNGAWHGTQSSASGTYYGAGVTTSSVAGVFDGTDDYIDPSLSLTYTTSSTFTWTAWVNLNSGIEGTNVILGDRGTTPWVKLTPSAFEYGNGGIMSNSIPFGQWELISIVKSGDSFYYYENAALETSVSSTAISSATLPFFIGTDPDDPQDGYTWGSVSDVRIYDTALSQGDIQSLYNEVLPPPVVSVSVTPTSTSLLADATTTFVATVSNASDTAVTWSAVYGTINGSGVYTAPSSTTSSTVTDTITATSVADPTKTATATVTVTPGLLGWWPTREGSGSIAYDVSGNGANGTWNGAPDGEDSSYYGSYDSDSTIEYAGAFDGSTNYIATSVAWPTSGSISLWADPSDISSWMSPAGWKYAPSSGGYILVDEGGSGNWRAVFNSSGLGEADVQSTSSIPFNEWSYVTMTWNKEGSTTTISLYVNGVPQGATTTTQTATSSIGDFYYGTAGQSANNDYNGYIDDVRVYDRALTPTEIQGIYNMEQPANSSTPPVLLSLS